MSYILEKESEVSKRIIAVVFQAIILCLCADAWADETPLLGTWRLKSFVREVTGTAERYNQLGDHPDGYINYSPDGRMIVFFVAADQPKLGKEPTDEERIKLHKTMLAYGGTYTVTQGKVVHHIDIEWDGRRLGTDQVRFYMIEGDRLLLKTEPNKSPVDGREGVGILAFERVTASRRK